MKGKSTASGDRRTIAAGISVLAVASGVLSAAVSARLGDTEFLVRILGIAAMSLLSPILVIRGRRDDWFRPEVLPYLYTVLVLVCPLLFVTLLGSLGLLDASELQPTTIVAAGAFVAFLIAGILIGRIAAPGPSPRTDDSREAIHVDWRFVRNTGVTVLVANVILRLPHLGAGFTNYGFGQTAYDGGANLTSVLNGSIFIGIALVTVANAQLRARTLRPPDVLVVGALAATVLAAGSRSPLIAPIVFLAFAQHTWVRPLRGIVAGGLLVAIVVLFQFVGQARGQHVPQQGTEISVTAAGALRPLSSPLWITNELVMHMPGRLSPVGGATYLASARRLLPGFINARILGAPRDTAAYRYRELIGFRNPNSGFGFSMLSEAYLNFGLIGCAIVPFLFGVLISKAWRWQRSVPTHSLHLLYPVLIASLPYGFRSDSLTHLKLIIYPVIGLSMALGIARRRGARSQLALSRGTVASAA